MNAVVLQELLQLRPMPGYHRDTSGYEQIEDMLRTREGEPSLLDLPEPYQLVADLPTGQVMHRLSQDYWTPEHTVVVTWNECPEYQEDLWSYGISGLLVSQLDANDLRQLRCGLLAGERNRLVSTSPTLLSPTERRVLRLIGPSFPGGSCSIPGSIY